MLKNKKDKIVTFSFPKFVSFYHLSARERLRISEILFAIFNTRILTGNRKEVFYLYQKKKRIKNNKHQGWFFKQKPTPLNICK